MRRHRPLFGALLDMVGIDRAIITNTNTYQAFANYPHGDQAKIKHIDRKALELADE